MAIIIPGPIVDRISGNLGGLNFVSNRGSTVVRIRKPNKKSASAAQLRSRAILTRVRTAWNGMTDTERMNWNTLASQVTNTNALGVLRNLSGLQLFLRWNIRSLTFLPVAIETAIPDLPTSASMVGLTITTIAPDTINLTWTSPVSLPVGRIWIYGARSFSTAPSKFFNTRVAITSIGSFVHPVNIGPAFTAVCGTPQPGELFSISTIVRFLNRLDSFEVSAQTHMAP